MEALFLALRRLVELAHDMQGSVPAPDESWQASADERSGDGTWRDGLTLSDGPPLTADDVAITRHATYDPRIHPPIFRDGLMIGDKPIEIKVADARHFTLTFAQEVNVPEQYMSNLAVMPRHALEAALNEGAFEQAYGISSDPKSIVTSGKFIVEESTPGARVVLERNPN